MLQVALLYSNTVKLCLLVIAFSVNIKMFNYFQLKKEEEEEEERGYFNTHWKNSRLVGTHFRTWILVNNYDDFNLIRIENFDQHSTSNNPKSYIIPTDILDITFCFSMVEHPLRFTQINSINENHMDNPCIPPHLLSAINNINNLFLYN